MNKTDNILKIITLLRNTPHQIMHKHDLFRALGKSRAQTYKMVAEFSKPTADRPAVFEMVGDRAILTEDFR
tara:strand:- start:28846 stop:29058 length:213 start_codon:yes stop_codon:yes gene_type:complete